MKQLRVGVIGAGMRASSYFRNLPPDIQPAVQLVALADPNEGNRIKFQDLFAGESQPRHYENGEALLDTEELDALIIGSPNHAHTEDAIRALPRQIPILLEKPVAIGLEECRRLWQAYVGAGQPPVTVGFVLRYSSFYQKIEELIRSEALGQVLSIDADEMLGTGLTAFFYRGWRRWDHLTGGFMVEKCCHDFDILNWMTGARATRVFSIAGRTHLTPRPDEERHRRFEPVRRAELDYGDAGTQSIFTALTDESPYDAASDVPDHQAVMIEFDNGILSSFTACVAQPRSARRMRVYGSAGALEGDIGRSRIVVDTPQTDSDGYDTHEETFPAGEGGHHGADPGISTTFWNTAMDLPATIRAGIREGIEAVLIGLAAEESKKSGLPVDVTRLRSEVFGAGE